jgi:hypothetical protein
MRQTALMVGSLLLLQASLDADVFGDASETWGSLALDERTGDVSGWRALSAGTQATVLDVAFRFSNSQWYDENFLGVVAGCGRRRAWSILEASAPLAEEQLIQVMLSERHSRYDRMRAAVILLARDPEVLAASRGLDAMVEVAAMDYWRTNGMWELMLRNADITPEVEGCCGGSHQWLLYDCFNSPEAIPAPFPAIHHGVACAKRSSPICAVRSRTKLNRGGRSESGRSCWRRKMKLRIR